MIKKEQLVNEIINVISTYNQKLTLRQVYYRLVAKLIIENTISQYKKLSSILVEIRLEKFVEREGFDSKEEFFKWFENPRYDYEKLITYKFEEAY